MLQLVRHFGDAADSGERCGHCDVCAPKNDAKASRVPTRAEVTWLSKILEVLRKKDGQPTGKLYAETLEGVTGRAQFQECLKALCRAGHVELTDEQFERGGETIRFKRAGLTQSGYGVGAEALAQVEIVVDAPAAGRSKSTVAGIERRKPQAAQDSAQRSGVEPKSRASSGANERFDLPDTELVRALKRWRKDRAGEQPAYRVLTDRALFGIAESQPTDDDGLLSIAGIGKGFVKNHGEDLLRFLRERHD
jgi:superfamily II DNA helicase RecQ